MYIYIYICIDYNYEVYFLKPLAHKGCSVTETASHLGALSLARQALAERLVEAADWNHALQADLNLGVWEMG